MDNPKYSVFDGRFWWKDTEDLFDTCFRMFAVNMKEAKSIAYDIGEDAVICKNEWDGGELVAVEAITKPPKLSPEEEAMCAMMFS